MTKLLLAFAFLSAGISASAKTQTPKDQTVSAFCGVNTYNFDGSDFKPLVGQNFDLKLGERSEVTRTTNALYTVIPKIYDQGKEPRFSLFVEIQDLKTGTTISAAETEWLPGVKGVHQVTAYSSVAETGIKTMIWCSVH